MVEKLLKLFETCIILRFIMRKGFKYFGQLLSEMKKKIEFC